jgi:hypothetical protein
MQMRFKQKLSLRIYLSNLLYIFMVVILNILAKNFYVKMY